MPEQKRTADETGWFGHSRIQICFLLIKTATLAITASAPIGARTNPTKARRFELLYWQPRLFGEVGNMKLQLLAINPKPRYREIIPRTKPSIDSAVSPIFPPMEWF